ncbi:MAG: hypothetical protein K0S46_1570 [Moraxellaceae bacterium]|jgi:hypothetical protein|nr:hypothetical protein [Moraxellaceae bacterium]
MRRQLTGIALSTLLLAGCASAPDNVDSGLYHAPARAYSLSLDSAAFRGKVSLTEQCDANGGSLNIWDTTNRFFRIDYLKIGQHPMADVPTFASERTIAEQVLSNYLRDVLPEMPNLDETQPLLQEFVDTGRGNAMFSVVSMKMKRSALPEGVTNARYFYGFLVFTRGDMVYVLQHRVDTYQPDNLKTLLSGLRQDMLIPGVLRQQKPGSDDPAVGRCG